MGYLIGFMGGLIFVLIFSRNKLSYIQEIEKLKELLSNCEKSENSYWESYNNANNKIYELENEIELLKKERDEKEKFEVINNSLKEDIEELRKNLDTANKYLNYCRSQLLRSEEIRTKSMELANELLEDNVRLCKGKN
jgi:peptidoglycan hydrolase CwlO-like protein